MKSILVATDFSTAAQNAVDYAAQLSLATGSNLVVVHAWSLPALTGETLFVPMTIMDIEKDMDAAMLAEADRIENKWNVKASCSHIMGFAADEIGNACKEHGAAIAVLGMRSGNKFGKIFGSVATKFIHINILPVLVVPENVSFKSPKVLLLATDLHTNADWHELDALNKIVEKLGAGIHILNVRQDEAVTNQSESRAGVRLDLRMKNVVHVWHFHENEDVTDSIFKTANETAADWIVVVPHRLPWAKQLFHASVSNKVAFATSRPLLALPERHIQLSF